MKSNLLHLLFAVSAVTCLSCGMISQNGINFTFAESYTCGQFINGDWWIIINETTKTVEITNIDPELDFEVYSNSNDNVCLGDNSPCGEFCREKEEEEGYDTSEHSNDYYLNPFCNGKNSVGDWFFGVCYCTYIRHGYQINPDYGVIQAFDNRFEYTDPTKIPNNGKFPLFIEAPSSLVKVESRSLNEWWINSNDNPLQWNSVLTILDSVPPDNALRPPVIGDDKPIFTFDSSYYGNFSDEFEFPWDKYTEDKYEESYLESLVPSVESVIYQFKFPIGDWKSGDYGFDPIREGGYQKDYQHRYIHNYNLIYRFLIGSETEREQIGPYIAQRGIDMFYNIKNGAKYNSFGIGFGQKMILTFAAILLDNEEMRSFLKTYDRSEEYFVEDLIVQEGKYSALFGIYSSNENDYWSNYAQSRDGSFSFADPVKLIDSGINSQGEVGGYILEYSKLLKYQSLLLIMVEEARSLFKNELMLQYVWRYVHYGLHTMPDICAKNPYGRLSNPYTYMGSRFGPNYDTEEIDCIVYGQGEVGPRLSTKHGSKVDTYETDRNMDYIEALWKEYHSYSPVCLYPRGDYNKETGKCSCYSMYFGNNCQIGWMQLIALSGGVITSFFLLVVIIIIFAIILVVGKTTKEDFCYPFIYIKEKNIVFDWESTIKRDESKGKKINFNSFAEGELKENVKDFFNSVPEEGYEFELKYSNIQKGQQNSVGNRNPRVNSVGGMYRNQRNVFLRKNPPVPKKDETEVEIGFQINKRLFVIKWDDIRLIEEIGSGGSSSTIFKAYWDDTVIAFKAYMSRGLKNKEYYEEFEKEINLMASLSHPNILEFFGAALKIPKIGIVMEYCEKGDLLQFFMLKSAKKEEVPYAKRIDILIGVVKGISFLHKKRVVHRDIKSSNILLTNQLVPKLCDFGLSKLIETNEGNTQRAGTSYYMAPEVTLGKDYDYRCDIFSFSIVIYEVITGLFRPYPKNEQFVEFKVANNPRYRPKLAGKFKIQEKAIVDIMRKMWDHEPFERPKLSLVLRVLLKNKKDFENNPWRD